jgi:hypothetical protein
MIKPEDVTKEHVAHIEDCLRSQSDWLLMPDNAQLATLANALIEVGIVSPPVWVIKKDAAIVSGCFSSHKNAVAYRDSLYEPAALTVEHWKGKTN